MAHPIGQTQKQQFLVMDITVPLTSKCVLKKHWTTQSTITKKLINMCEG